MKLAISNIAWEKHDDQNVLDLLNKSGVRGIEIAPTKIWSDWKNINKISAQDYKKKMLNNGFEIPAMQAIVYGRSDLQIFQPDTHDAFLEHVRLLAELAENLGTKVLVFGAPKNRLRGQVSMRNSIEIAVRLMRKIGQICYDKGCCIGWEHNPVEYGCDFITNINDAKEFVDIINHPGVRLHVDSAGLYMCGGEINSILKNIGSFVHYHASEPMLAPIANGIVDHKALLSTLDEIGYEGWVSIEMKMTKKNILETISKSISKLL